MEFDNLYRAVTSYNTEELKNLLERESRTSLEYEGIRGGETPLYLHVLLQDRVGGHLNSQDLIECTKLLIKHGVDVNAIDDKGHSALHYAVSNGFEKCASILTKNGAQIHDQEVKTENEHHHELATKLATKMPNVLKKVFDRSVTYNQHGNSRTKDLLLDFNMILQFPENRDDHKNKLKSLWEKINYKLYAKGQEETSFLYTILNAHLKYEDQEKIFLHPLVKAFVHRKEMKTTKTLFLVYIAVFLFPLFYLGYIYYFYIHLCPYDKFGALPNSTVECATPGLQLQNGIIICNPVSAHEGCSGDNFRAPDCYNCTCKMRWDVSLWSYTLGLLMCLWLLVEIVNVIRQDWRILFGWRNWVTRVCIIAMAFTIWPGFQVSAQKSLDFQYPIAAVGIFFACTLFLIQIGTKPIFSVYVDTLAQILISVCKVYLLFLPLLIGFYFGFSLMYKTGGWIFRYILMSTTIEIDTYTDLVEETQKSDRFFFQGMGYTFVVAFTLIIVIVFINFMMGIAIYNIEEIFKKAKTSVIKRQIENHYIIDSLGDWCRVSKPNYPHKHEYSSTGTHEVKNRTWLFLGSTEFTTLDFPEELTDELIKLANENAKTRKRKLPRCHDEKDMSTRDSADTQR